ncbi:MAG: FkbM family methyltransferase, partial [Acidobacteria bacterium]|nr:FkbM family methyltransferase [Acidobacteriota bacterium]
KERHTCRIILAVQPDLQPLLEQVPGIDGFVAPDDRASCAGVDVYCPLLSLPGALGETGDRDWTDVVPYLRPHPERAAEWRRRLAGEDGFRVGVVWQGNPRHPADWLRSFPLAALDPLRRLHGVRLISMQQGDGAEQLDGWAGIPPITPLGEDLDAATGRFEETAAVLASLDLLICADTAVAHLAGAMGRPVWLALGRAPDWRWGPAGDRTPWYPTVRLFRRQEMDDWPDLFARMAGELLAAGPGVRRRTADEYRLLDCGQNRLAQTHQGVMMYPRHDRYVGRSLELYGEFSPGETELLRQVVGPGMTVVDAGAHVGAHTLLLARRVGPEGVVHAFEPQPVLFHMLCANLSLNGWSHVVAHSVALGAEPGAAYLPSVDYGREGNFGGVALSDDPPGECVPVVTLDGLTLSACHFLKIDVEGMERAVLAGARETVRRHRPVLYVENDRAEHSAGLILLLMELEYRLYWHLAPLYSPDNYYGNPVNEFGHLVSANMLGIPCERKFPVVGLRPVSAADSRWDLPDRD